MSRMGKQDTAAQPERSGGGAPDEISDVMVSAGAAVIEWRAATATHEELARLVYKAMTAAKLGTDDALRARSTQAFRG
jgi:hypothetical protein